MTIQQIKDLSFWDKQKIYSHHLSVELGLKYTVFPEIKIKSFTEFIDESNIEVRDIGPDWQKNGFAQRFWTQTYGIYEWAWKFSLKEFHINE